jgi:multidrug efflux pump subunit AcrB
MSAVLGQFATRNATAITFITVALCLAGVFAALRMPSSVFPQTNFPRCVILIELAFFYDQSLLVRASVQSVWEAILFGLILSVAIIYLFLKDWGTTVTAIVVIPVTVLVTLVAMRAAGLSFNLMTLGGIGPRSGWSSTMPSWWWKRCMQCAAGLPRIEAVHSAIADIFRPMVGFTLTPVVVFVPLAFLGGITGVFFRALALTMVVSLVTSLVLAMTLPPSLAAWFIRDRGHRDDGGERAGGGPSEPAPASHDGGFILRRILRLYETSLRFALRRRWLALLGCALVLGANGISPGYSPTSSAT